MPFVVVTFELLWWRIETLRPGPAVEAGCLGETPAPDLLADYSSLLSTLVVPPTGSLKDPVVETLASLVPAL